MRAFCAPRLPSLHQFIVMNHVTTTDFTSSRAARINCQRPIQEARCHVSVGRRAIAHPQRIHHFNRNNIVRREIEVNKE
ncbi:MAG: hypothetical protein JWQ07_4751 [Ramlibacter sp.]|nr:hypothetical protein [Ramlibacter sp.]